MIDINLSSLKKWQIGITKGGPSTVLDVPKKPPLLIYKSKMDLAKEYGKDWRTIDRMIKWWELISIESVNKVGTSRWVGYVSKEDVVKYLLRNFF